jgi:hypothetical protein
MNIDSIFEITRQEGFKQIILMAFIIFSGILVGFNLLYLNQSLHITSKHMGIDSPVYLRQLIKIGIFFAVISAGFSLFILITGMY